MPGIVSIELFELDLPFRQPFRHAAARSSHSSSLFVRLATDGGQVGFGETLPRRYVTGEERSDTFDLLSERILPRLLNSEFATFSDLLDFLIRCDGKAPEAWVSPEIPQTAAWCLVDLALLDGFGREFGGDPLRELGSRLPGAIPNAWPPEVRYSLVLSGEPDRRTFATLAKARLYGIRDMKVKVDRDPLERVRFARRVLGERSRVRVDSNMAWGFEEARDWMPRLAALGVESFEQPLPAGDLDGMSRLVAETGLAVMADEAMHDAASLERLISARACTAVNVRIAKCGGLVAALARCRRALEAGLVLQVGCHVGESSQLSAAQMVLIQLLGDRVRYAEGCFGERLLLADPIRPSLKFRRGGIPPHRPRGVGFGTAVDMRTIHRFARRSIALGPPISTAAQESR